MQSDVDVIKQSKSGNLDAFQTLVERYQVEAFGHALMLLEHREDALDALQEAFLDAFRAIDRFDLSREFYPWFYVILRNRCYKQIEGRKRREAVGLIEPMLSQLVTAPDCGAADELNDALRALGHESREIITLKYLDGLTYAELAQRLSIPAGTVMSRLYHARCKLRSLLIEDADEVTTREREES